jgi:hypothetical protein
MLFGRYMAVICPCMPAKVCSLHLNHRRRWIDVPYVLYSIWPERAVPAMSCLDFRAFLHPSVAFADFVFR